MTNLAMASSVPKTDLSVHDLAASPIQTSLWRGVLLVEPDMTLLNAETLLLTRSDYCVTPAFGQREIFALRETKALALAILSDSLGPRLLATVAHTVRKQWPRARILILGRPGPELEDHLYDEQIDHSSNPKQLLEDIESLYKNSWNQRTHMLDWDAKQLGVRAVRSSIRESDPTKERPLEVQTEHPAIRGASSGIRYRSR